MIPTEEEKITSIEGRYVLIHNYDKIKSYECNTKFIEYETQKFLNDKCSIECSNLGLSQTHFFVENSTGNILGYVTITPFYLECYKKGPRGLKEADITKKDFFGAIKIDKVDFHDNEIGVIMFKKLIGNIRKEILQKLRPRFLVIWIREEKNDELRKIIQGKEFEEKFKIIPEDWMSSSINKAVSQHRKHKFKRGEIKEIYELFFVDLIGEL